MSETLQSVLEALGAPDKRFWEHDLEVAAEAVWQRAGEADFGEAWLAKRNRWQLAILRQGLAKRGETAAVGDYRALLPYYLVDEFVKYKSKAAIVEHCREALPPMLRLLCEKRSDEYDPLAMCFALYQMRPNELAVLLCREKVYRSGFARMRLLQNVRRPGQAFADFLQHDLVAGVLKSLDEQHEPTQRSELRAILVDDGRPRVFIRRPQRPAKLIERKGIRHGYRPEWVILEFLESGKRVNVASKSIRRPLEIADRLATLYYGSQCQYADENLVTYAAQLRRFLRWLQNGGDDELQVVELAVTNSPLAGSPKVRISQSRSRSIGQAIAHFERSIGPILDDVDRIEGVKVLFCQKRVNLVFESLGGDEYVVRYSDHRLDPPERKALEDYLGKNHAIAILSTEKRDAA